MPIPEPGGLLWQLVKPLSGWPETNEESARQMAQGWANGVDVFRAVATFDTGPLEGAWPDEPGQAFKKRVWGTLTTAIDTADSMSGLITQSLRLAEAVTHAKTSIRSLMSAGEELLEGNAYFPPLLTQTLITLVPRLAGEVNDILARTAATVGASPDLPGAPVPPPAEFTAGEPGSDPNALDQLVAEPLYDTAATAAHGLLPDGAEHLAHYFDGTGTPMDVSPDDVIAAVPKLGTLTNAQLDAELHRVAEQAVANGDYGRPIPFQSSWVKTNIEPGDDLNWHVAMGNVQHSVSGVAVVHPPVTPGGAPTVEVTHQTHFHDPYNWNPNDPNKVLKVAGIEIPGTDDPFLGSFHRAGTAQEYDATGSSAPRTETREIR